MTPIIIVVAVAALISWGIIASRRTSAHKKEAIADLQVQQEQLPTFDIHALVSAEIADLGLRSINGAAGIPPSVLLKTWKGNIDTVNNCPSNDLLSFVVTAGLDPSEALDSDVTLVCDADAADSTEAPADEQPDVEDDTPDPTTNQESE